MGSIAHRKPGLWLAACALTLLMATAARAQGGATAFDRLGRGVQQRAWEDLESARVALLSLFRKAASGTRYRQVLVEILDAESRLLSTAVSVDDPRLLSAQVPEGVPTRRIGPVLAYRILRSRLRLEAAPGVGDLRKTFDGRGGWVLHKPTGRRGHVALSP